MHSRPRLASLSVIDIRSGTIKSTAATKSRDSASLIDWLNTAFGENGSRPESLYLIGSRSELDALAGPLNEGVSIPVVATHDAQLALARGAVFSDKTHVHVDDPVIEERSGFAFYASKLAVVLVVAAASLFTLSAAASPIRLVEKDSQQAATEAVQPETISAAVAETTAVAPPAQHLPEVQPVEHIPETQQAGVPESPPVAPGPIAPPPPLDPLVGVLSPLFSGLP